MDRLCNACVTPVVTPCEVPCACVTPCLSQHNTIAKPTIRGYMFHSTETLKCSYSTRKLLSRQKTLFSPALQGVTAAGLLAAGAVCVYRQTKSALSKPWVPPYASSMDHASHPFVYTNTQIDQGTASNSSNEHTCSATASAEFLECEHSLRSCFRQAAAESKPSLAIQALQDRSPLQNPYRWTQLAHRPTTDPQKYQAVIHKLAVTAYSQPDWLVRAIAESLCERMVWDLVKIKGVDTRLLNPTAQQWKSRGRCSTSTLTVKDLIIRLSTVAQKMNKTSQIKDLGKKLLRVLKGKEQAMTVQLDSILRDITRCLEDGSTMEDFISCGGFEPMHLLLTIIRNCEKQDSHLTPTSSDPTLSLHLTRALHRLSISSNCDLHRMVRQGGFLSHLVTWSRSNHSELRSMADMTLVNLLAHPNITMEHNEKQVPLDSSMSPTQLGNDQSSDEHQEMSSNSMKLPQKPEATESTDEHTLDRYLKMSPNQFEDLAVYDYRVALLHPTYTDPLVGSNTESKNSTTEQKRAVDVVFVHGVWGNPFWTWRQGKQSKKGPKSQENLDAHFPKSEVKKDQHTEYDHKESMPTDQSNPSRSQYAKKESGDLNKMSGQIAGQADAARTDRPEDSGHKSDCWPREWLPEMCSQPVRLLALSYRSATINLWPGVWTALVSAASTGAGKTLSYLPLHLKPAESGKGVNHIHNSTETFPVHADTSIDSSPKDLKSERSVNSSHSSNPLLQSDKYWSSGAREDSLAILIGGERNEHSGGDNNKHAAMANQKPGSRTTVDIVRSAYSSVSESAGAYFEKERSSDPKASADKVLKARAHELLVSLRKAGVGQRPVVFVGHSLGGILTKYLLLEDSQSGETEEGGTIHRQVAAVVFLSTPHHGAPLAVVRGWQETEPLAPSSRHLRELDREFSLLGVPSVSVCETEPVTWRNFNVHLVPPKYSEISYGKNIHLSETHLSISKPTSKEHPVVQLIAETINKAATKAEKDAAASQENPTAANASKQTARPDIKGTGTSDGCSAHKCNLR